MGILTETASSACNLAVTAAAATADAVGSPPGASAIDWIVVFGGIMAYNDREKQPRLFFKNRTTIPYLANAKKYPT